MVLLLASFLSAWAGSLAGVTLPDAITSKGGAPLVLNGMGLREMLWIDIYVGALYLPAKTQDAKAAIQQDVPKRVVMHFIYRSVTKEQILKTFDEAFAKAPAAASLRPQIDQLKAAIDGGAVAGDQILIDYEPGVGTTLTIKGVKKVTIPGADFMRLLWGVWLGDSPPSENLKRGMLGR